MTSRPVIMVGFVPVALTSLAEFQPPGSVIVIEEPDVIRKRDVAEKVRDAPVARGVIPWEYQVAGAADAFYNTHSDLDPVAIAPLQEYATPFAARLAERFGLPGAGFGAVELLRNKALLRTVTAAAGIANPESETVTGVQDVLRFMSAHPGRVVLKPANRQAAVGTRIVDHPDQVEQAWSECVLQDEGVMVPDRGFPLHMLVERYVHGHEYSVEMLVDKGEQVFANITDKVLFAGDRPIEAGHVVPADLPAATAELLLDQTRQVLRAVGFGTGIVHCEWIVTDGVSYLVECAGRFAGDGIIDLVERAYPVELVRAFWTLLRGEPLPHPLPTRAEQAAAVAFLHGEPGEVLHVAGLEEMTSAPGVVSGYLGVQPGDRIRELRSSWDRIGAVTVVSPTAEEALRRAQDATRLVQVKVQPAAPDTEHPAADQTGEATA
ncbi:biotin carboxylase [Micromonospora rosaria]|uniref:Biotin carboxylase n=1 Tax=Micromonospora rosaria TaxID=47874 RepID=A0A136PVE4_9ACTN|nr:ATP-grasp domain-containing protein [Micromonospora rosaria]KXK62439.1 biotin carboxylase [Micromonospora rosaria]